MIKNDNYAFWQGSPSFHRLKVSLLTHAHCSLGKHCRVSFCYRSKRKENILESIHSDLSGPIKVKSGGNKYFVTFIDDAS